MGFPNENELKRIRAKLKKNQGFLMLSPSADELSKFRFNICQELFKYASKHNLTAVEMAKFLRITKADMSRITRFSTVDVLPALKGRGFP